MSELCRALIAGGILFGWTIGGVAGATIMWGFLNDGKRQ